MKKIATEIPDRFSVGNHDSVVWIERLVQTTFCWRFDLEGAVAKANFRLQSPSWHTRIWSRVAILDVV